MRTFHKVYVILFFIFFFGIGICLLTRHPNDYSKNENRYLEAFPEFSFDAYFKGDFQSQIEKASTDQFPARDVLTGMSTGIRKVIGLHDVGDVYLGNDHYYLDKKLEKDISLSQYEKNINAIKTYEDKFGLVDVMLVPSPATVMSDKLPLTAKIYDETPYVEKAKELFGERFLDIREYLSDNKTTDTDNTPAYSTDNTSEYTEDSGNKSDSNENITGLYFRTDHHWTDAGAYQGYLYYMEAVGLTPRDRDDFDYQTVSTDFYGTMFSRALDMGAVPDTISIPRVPDSVIVQNGDSEIPFYDMDKLDTKDQYAVYLGGNYPCVTIDNPEASSDKTLMIFKDSFANSLVPLLSYEYQRIVLIDLRYETRPMGTLVETYHPDETLVLYEISNFATGSEPIRMAVS